MKKKFNDIYKPVIDTPTLTFGSIVINEELLDEAYTKPNWKTLEYVVKDFKKWEKDVIKFGGEVDYDHHGGLGGVKRHVARVKGDDESNFGSFVIGSHIPGRDGGALTIDINKYKINESVDPFDSHSNGVITGGVILPQSDMTEPLNALIEEINLLKKSIQAQQKLIEELQQRPITESLTVDLEPLLDRIKKLESKKITESKPKGWKIIRDDDGNLERIIAEE